MPELSEQTVAGLRAFLPAAASVGNPVDMLASAPAEHLVIVHPLWLGAMPALLKGFLEQALRPGFALDPEPGATGWGKRLTGRSARIVVTMGMPALVYRWFFRAHSLKSLERNILKFVGIKPVRETLIGMVGAMDERKAGRWLDKMRALGRAGG